MADGREKKKKPKEVAWIQTEKASQKASWNKNGFFIQHWKYITASYCFLPGAEKAIVSQRPGVFENEDDDDEWLALWNDD